MYKICEADKDQNKTGVEKEYENCGEWMGEVMQYHDKGWTVLYPDSAESTEITVCLPRHSEVEEVFVCENRADERHTFTVRNKFDGNEFHLAVTECFFFEDSPVMREFTAGMDYRRLKDYLLMNFRSVELASRRVF